MVPLIRNLLRHGKPIGYRTLTCANRRDFHRFNPSSIAGKHSLANSNRNLPRCPHYVTTRHLTNTHDKAILCEQLTGRGVVRIVGSDTDSFFQGLITNDMARFEGDDQNPPCEAMYSMMLNVQVLT